MIKRLLGGLIRLQKSRNGFELGRHMSDFKMDYNDIFKDESNEDQEEKLRRLTEMRHKYPEFLPDPTLRYRNALREKLEREDMMRRRSVLNIPEFYVGSILAVTSSDFYNPGKLNRFLGICIMRKEYGMRTYFILRNAIDNEGVEVFYHLYSPLIHKMEIIRLEKRLDNELLYLRDAPIEYSTFPFDMDANYISEDYKVPINTIKVPLNPRPWVQRYDKMNLKGAIIPEGTVTEKMKEQAKKLEKPWEKYDLMDIYRKCVPEEDMVSIFGELKEKLDVLESKQRVEKRKKEFIKPQRQKLF